MQEYYERKTLLIVSIPFETTYNKKSKNKKQKKKIEKEVQKKKKEKKRNRGKKMDKKEKKKAHCIFITKSDLV